MNAKGPKGSSMDQKEHQGTMRKIKGSIEPYRDQCYSLEKIPRRLSRDQIKPQEPRLINKQDFKNVESSFSSHIWL